MALDDYIGLTLPPEVERASADPQEPQSFRDVKELTVTESSFPAMGEILKTDSFVACSASPLLSGCGPGQTYPL